MDTTSPNPPPRLLFLTQEFTLGGASYLTLRHIKRLLPTHSIDLCITGAYEERMLIQVPKEVSIFTLPNVTPNINSIGKSTAFGTLELFLKYKPFLPTSNTYQAIFATSIFSDWKACFILSLTFAIHKFIFLVDTALLAFPNHNPHERYIIENCILSSDMILPVSESLWLAMSKVCTPLYQRPWKVLYPPIDITLA